MKFDLILLGKTKAEYISAGIDDYCNRLKHYAEINVRVLKVGPPGRKNAEQIKNEEADILLSHLEDRSLVIALDPKGRSLSSEDMAEKLEFWEESGRQHITILIGGPFGLARKVLDRADQLISLSKMTFTHDMTRLIILEQLYRAFNINRRTGYHK